MPTRHRSDGRRWGRPTRLLATGAGLLAAEIAGYGLYVRRHRRSGTATPGLLIVQIDGLALSILQALIDAGRMPVLAGLIASGQSALRPWLPMMPTTTPASQAGILHGDNDDISGFRWYEKETGRMLVADHPNDAAEIVRRVSDGNGLLAADGASIGNLVTGDAQRIYLTTATVERRPGPPASVSSARAFFLRPSSYVRVFGLMTIEMGRELAEAIVDRRAGLRPRGQRGLYSAVERAVTNVALRIVAAALVAEELARGTSIIYVDFVAYDAIAHHSGPKRPEALSAAHGLDTTIGLLVAAIRRAPRPYRLVVLSDHGQSTGPTFRQHFGESLEDVLGRLANRRVGSSAGSEPAEHRHGWRRFASEIARLPIVGRVIGAVLAGLERAATNAPGSAEPEVILAASGNLGHIYVTTHPGKVSLEEIAVAFPGFTDGLAAHPGIGVVVARTNGRPVAIGRAGRHWLDDDAVEGTDPLVPYGPLAASSLHRLHGFAHSGDLIVMSAFDPATVDVIAIEELFGSHGGLGGAQAEPFLLHPTDWEIEADPLIGAPALGRQLRKWRDALRGDGRIAGGTTPPEGLSMGRRPDSRRPWRSSFQ